MSVLQIVWLIAGRPMVDRSEKVRSMPRRVAKITQGEIARVIRAAKEAGAGEVIIDGQGQIRVVLSSKAPAASTSPSEETDDGPVWTMSVSARRERWSSRDSTSWRYPETPAQTLISTVGRCLFVASVLASRASRLMSLGSPRRRRSYGPLGGSGPEWERSDFGVTESRYLS